MSGKSCDAAVAGIGWNTALTMDARSTTSATTNDTNVRARCLIRPPGVGGCDGGCDLALQAFPLSAFPKRIRGSEQYRGIGSEIVSHSRGLLSAFPSLGVGAPLG